MVSLSPAAAGLLDRTRAASVASAKAADLFAGDVAVGVVFDLRLLAGIPLSLAPFAAFAKTDGSPRLVGFYWSDSAASAALAGPFTAAIGGTK